MRLGRAAFFGGDPPSHTRAGNVLLIAQSSGCWLCLNACSEAQSLMMVLLAQDQHAPPLNLEPLPGRATPGLGRPFHVTRDWGG